MNWKPIESAPKGQRVLIRTQYQSYSFSAGKYIDRGEIIVDAWYHPLDNKWDDWIGGNKRDCTTASYKPTEWTEHPFLESNY